MKLNIFARNGNFGLISSALSDSEFSFAIGYTRRSKSHLTTTSLSL